MPDLRAPDGTPTKAVLVFTNMLLKTLREEDPEFCAVVFDARGKTFRHQLYDAYKAGRDAQPEDLSAQIPLAHEVVRALALPILEVPEVEADDVIASLVRATPEETQVSVVSTDRDLMQLVDDRVQLLDGIRDRRYGPTEVEARFGVPPSQVLDVRALVGDKSDNIPGVKGIGEKGAAQLIQTWGDLENLIAHADEIKAKRAREALQNHPEDARLSKELATLREDVALPKFDTLRRAEADRSVLRDLYARLGFTRLLQSLDAEGDVPAPRSDTEVRVEIVDDADALVALGESIGTWPSATLVAVDAGGTAVSARALGVALARDGDQAWFVPLGADGHDFEALAAALDPLVSANVGWVSNDTKRLQSLFAEQGHPLPPPSFDVELAGALLDPSGPQGTSPLAKALIGRSVRSWEDLAGRGAKATPAEELETAELAPWLGECAAAVSALVSPLAERLDGLGLLSLFEDVELPLTRVLGAMERNGVRVDESVLAQLSTEYAGQLASIEKEIYAAAGEEFLVSSPKQLQRILFEKLKLPPIKKTKTGFSTDEGVLEQLAEQHPLPAQVLAYRRLSKLVSTYVDALPPLVDAATARVHPTFHQLGAATGRLSATQPNVQNIPIRTEEGIRIREAFVPAEGCVLASADYSQVELRILAHFSEDPSLIAAFERR